MKFQKLTAALLVVVLTFILIPFATFAEVSDTDVSETDVSVSEEVSGEVPDEVSEEPDEVSEESELPPAPEDCTVTVSCAVGGSYTVEGNDGGRPSKHEYYYVTGNVCSIFVTADEGYRVSNVTVSGTQAQEIGTNAWSFEITGDHTVTIEFEALQLYPITVQCQDTDGNDVDGVTALINEMFVGTEISLVEGYEYVIKFVALAGYELVATELFTGTRYIDVPNPYTDTVVESTAYRVTVRAIPTYNGTLSVGENGIINVNGLPAVDSISVNQGEQSVIEIIPNEGYELDKLLINDEEVEVDGTLCYFTPEGDFTVSVTFKVKVDYCKITLSIGNGGSILVKDELYEIENKKYIYVPIGETVVLIFEPHINYEVNTVKVSGKTVTLNEENEFEILCSDTAATVSATFRSTEENEEVSYTVTAYASGGGTISPSGASEVLEGEDITFTITPNEGYEIYSVTVDGEDVLLTGGEYTVENVSANMVINATFKKASVTDVAVTVEDIDWTADVIVIDISERSGVSAEIFARAADNYPEKQIMISDTEFTLIIPANGGFRPAGDVITFDFMRNGSPNFVAVQDALAAEYPGATIVTVYCDAPALPVGTVLEIFLGSEFAGADLNPLEYLSGALNSIGNTVTADEKGWATFNYANEIDLAFVEVTENKAVLTVTYDAAMGKVDPAGTVKINIGENKVITVTPNEGYVVSKVLVDGQEIELTDDGVYTLTMDTDHTFAVEFGEASGANAGLIIALVIIALCLVGGAAVFVIRWRKNQF